MSTSPRDYLLEISFDASDSALEELIQARLFVTASTGSTSAEGAGTGTVTAYFDTPEERDAARAAFDGLPVELNATDRERLNWLDVYQQSLRPIFIGERFVVAPEQSLVPRHTERTALIVPQEQAFGTGSHETTALCMELLEGLPVAGSQGLDVGAGSGILALAMIRLGARKVIAFDNDPDAYGALRDNRMRNGVGEGAIPLFIGGIESLRGGSFDVVTMNIVPEVIIPILGAVVERMAASAHLVISGVLAGRRDEVVAAAAGHGLWLAEEREQGEWWAGVAARTNLSSRA